MPVAPVLVHQSPKFSRGSSPGNRPMGSATHVNMRFWTNCELVSSPTPRWSTYKISLCYCPSCQCSFGPNLLSGDRTTISTMLNLSDLIHWASSFRVKTFPSQCVPSACDIRNSCGPASDRKEQYPSTHFPFPLLPLSADSVAPPSPCTLLSELSSASGFCKSTTLLRASTSIPSGI